MQFPTCLEKNKIEKCFCGDIYCIGDWYECQNKTFNCEKCSEGLCLLCYSQCEYCNFVLCFNCYDNYDNNFCFKNWFSQVENITCKIFNKYNLLEINLKDYILSYINNGKF